MELYKPDLWRCRDSTFMVFFQRGEIKRGSNGVTKAGVREGFSHAMLMISQT